MTTLDRYIGRAVVLYFVLALGGFVSIFSIISLMEELRSVGEGRYDGWAAFLYVTLRLPAEAFELFPGAALLGAVLALSSLASRSELIAMHASGLSFHRLAAAVVEAGVLLGIVMLLLAEFVAAPLARSAQLQRTALISDGTTLSATHGMWSRAGTAFVHVRAPLDGSTLGDVVLYEVDDRNRLARVTRAEAAAHTDVGWNLTGVAESTFGDDGVSVVQVGEKVWNGLPEPRGIQTLLLPAEDLALSDLSTAIAGLRRERLLAHRYELAYGKRLTTPLIALMMMLLAVPLVAGSLGERGRARPIISAVLIGVGFQMAHQTFGTFALVYRLSPLFGAGAPLLVALAAGLWSLRRLR